MHKFTLYETASRYYVVGTDVLDSKIKVLKIDRTAEPGDLVIVEDDVVYSKDELNRLLRDIDEGNKGTGGLILKFATWGIIGFIRFTSIYYMLLITRRSQVAMIGGHYIYQIDATELVPLTTASSKNKHSNVEESRFLGIFKNLDLTRSFYFSYSYDITRTLQFNILREREAFATSAEHQERQFNDMFTWNHYLLQPAAAALKHTYDWCLPIVHGYVDQAILSVYGRPIYITIIARRSRYFAGARFLKRGANDLGYVANDVETEQIVSEMITTSFHSPGPRMFSNPSYTSYVQHRGSIPLYWSQDSTGVTPKPPIELNLVDPFFSAAALHFDNLFERYGVPVIVLNLIKARERTPRESKLLKEFANAIDYLNQFLPEEKKIIYRPWDMSRASKSRDQDVIGTLESIAKDVIQTTGFFHNGDQATSSMTLQNGVCRTNCIDCLDRTNAAQFVIGKRALGHQLHALGVIKEQNVAYDTDAVNLFTHMYHDHGDTIAIQYGGSHLVNTMETYRKINQWTSHSRDMVESFKRYYNNSFLDSQRQEAYNLFLGNYIFTQGQPMLWDLETDYYLHHADPRAWLNRNRRGYTDWFTPKFLESFDSPPAPLLLSDLSEQPLQAYDNYWFEYYRPLAVSSFLKIFSFKMNSTLRYIPLKLSSEDRYDMSPFRVRSAADHENVEKKIAKNVVVVDPKSEPDNHLDTLTMLKERKTPIQRWLQPGLRKSLAAAAELVNIREEVEEPHRTTAEKKIEKAIAAQLTLEQYVQNSLNPYVTQRENDEYQRYVNHPLSLSVVSTTKLEPGAGSEYVYFVNSVSPDRVTDLSVPEEDIYDYEEFVSVAENPLTVDESDAPKKRYKAYGQWLRGKSLFKNQRLD